MKYIFCFLAIVTISMLGDIRDSLKIIASPPTHNTEGGYIEACGEAAGLLGDDC